MAKRAGKPHPEIVAAVLADAALIGDKAAAKKHGISERTIGRYRKDSVQTPDVSERVREKIEAVTDDWLAETQRVRMKLLARVEILGETSKNLHEVAGAFDVPARRQRLPQHVRLDGRFEEDVRIAYAVGASLQCLSCIEKYMAPQLFRLPDFNNKSAIRRAWYRHAARQTPAGEPAFDQCKIYSVQFEFSVIHFPVSSRHRSRRWCR